ncbi:MAG: uroporphyrinogen decarboxylase family protein [Fusobacteriaceae bacterium]
MNSRERFINAINKKNVDRPPIVGNLTIQLAEKLAENLKLPVEFIDSFLATRISHSQILLTLGNDAVIVAGTRAGNHPTITLKNGHAKDEWGLEYEQIGLYMEAVKRPLSEVLTISDIANYEFPDVTDSYRWQFSEETIKKHKNDYGIIGDLEACIFELAWNLVGMEKFLMDLYTGEEYVDVLLDKILDFSILSGLKMIELGVDVVWTGDDFGTQSEMMISPELWRKYFKPRMCKMFNIFKEKNKDIKIAYHSCGCIAQIVPDLIEIGLDILNPLQPLAANMEISSLFSKYKNELVFFGGIDVQNILPNGSTEDVRNEVRRCLKATEGGKQYIIAPAHNMQPDTPIENVFAFYDEAKKVKK